MLVADNATTTAVAALIAAVAALGQVVVLVIAAIYAKRQVNAAKDQLDEARSLRQARSRPYVSIDFEIRNKIIHLVVENYGSVMAHDVRFTFDPQLRSEMVKHIPDLKMFRPEEGIRSLPPGKRIDTVFDVFPSREQSELKTEDVYDATIRYRSEVHGTVFEDRVTLDLGIYRDRISVHENNIHDIHKRLEEMRDVMKRWGAVGGGLLRLSPEEARRRFEPDDPQDA